MMSRFERMERLIPEEGIARLERAHVAVSVSYTHLRCV